MGAQPESFLREELVRLVASSDTASYTLQLALRLWHCWADSGDT